MPTNFFGTTEVAGMIMKTLMCWVNVLLRDIISHFSLFSISSLDLDDASNGVDHGSTRGWVGLWYECTGNYGNDHNGYLYLLPSWSHAWGGRAKPSVSPNRHTRSTPYSAFSSLGLSTVSIVERRDGAYVSWSTLYGDIAPACCHSDWIEFHHHPGLDGSLTSDSWLPSKC